MAKGWLFVIEDDRGSIPVRVGLESVAEARQAALDAVGGFGTVVLENPQDDASLQSEEIKIGERFTMVTKAAPKLLN